MMEGDDYERCENSHEKAWTFCWECVRAYRAEIHKEVAGAESHATQYRNALEELIRWCEAYRGVALVRGGVGKPLSKEQWEECGEEIQEAQNARDD